VFLLKKGISSTSEKSRPVKNAKKHKKGSKKTKKGKKMEKNEYLWAFLLFRNEKVSKKGFLRAEKSPNRPLLDPPKVPYNTNTDS